MRRLFWLMFLSTSISTLVISQQGTKAGGIQWVAGLTWDQVKEKAKVENKSIFVDAYATWCAPCKKMDKDVYPDKRVGDAVNPRFTSVKVQMDRTSKDNEEVKAWYPVAQLLNEKYKVEGYPSFLFFSPEGKLVHQGIGLKTPDTFIALIKEALTDPIGSYQNRVDKFKNGELENATMPNLAIEARNKGDKQTANAIAKKFKEGYLDKLSDVQAFTKDNLIFLGQFASVLLNSKDRYFKLFYYRSNLADSIMRHQLLKANRIASAVIQKEEIRDKIFEDGKPVNEDRFDWNNIIHSVKTKYPKIAIDSIVLGYQTYYYEQTRDWPQLLRYYTIGIDKHGVKTLGIAPVNEIVAAFFLCNDSTILSRTLSWVEPHLLRQIAERGLYDIKKNGAKGLGLPFNNDFSNYACILYKMGRVDEAIAWVELSVNLYRLEFESSGEDFYAEQIKTKENILNRMKKGEKINDTWKYNWFF